MSAFLADVAHRDFRHNFILTRKRGWELKRRKNRAASSLQGNFYSIVYDNKMMNKQELKFWHDTFQASRYLWLGIVFSVIMLFWKPAFPYVYVGAIGGFLQFLFEIMFYRQTPRPQVIIFTLAFILGFLSPLARDLYAQPSNWLFVSAVLQTMLMSAYLGIRALLFLIFKPAIMKHIGLKID